MFGDLVRSCFDLFRGDLLAHLGWPAPQTLAGERALGGARAAAVPAQRELG